MELEINVERVQLENWMYMECQELDIFIFLSLISLPLTREIMFLKKDVELKMNVMSRMRMYYLSVYQLENEMCI